MKGQEIKQNDNLNRKVKTERPRGREEWNRQERHIQEKADRTEQTGQCRQDRADRTAHTGENKQVRTTRIRKTGQGKFNHTIGTLLCRQKRVSPCKIQVLLYYSIYLRIQPTRTLKYVRSETKKSMKTWLYKKFNTILPLMSLKDTSDESFSKIFAR
jgi:hypothetical protein